jgi:hypothetical protein
VYNIQVEARDGDGNLLDTAARDVRLGVVAGQVTALSATPAAFDPGQVITASLTFSNTGTTALAGTVIMQVQTADGLTVTATFTQTFASLAPGASVQTLKVWDTTGAALGAYRILGYALYEGQTSEPLAVTINTKYRVYLPIVIR